nr:MAG TPA: hypothetical protein [Caudoviricetes sp.]
MQYPLRRARDRGGVGRLGRQRVAGGKLDRLQNCNNL